MKSLKVNLLFAVLMLGLTFTVRSQVKNDDVLMTIAGKKITVGEFVSIYQKNNQKNEVLDKKNLSDYLDLYINFKLKVHEAEDLGLDTVTSFKTELSGYREQLAKPYFVDEPTLDRITHEAYDRMHSDVRGSHIFIRLQPCPMPEDTLKAYTTILEIRERITKGESFEKLAGELSEDPSARDREASQQHPFIKGNHGDLGYFTAFDMVYPFETGAYTTPVGSVTMPIRSEYGYHLIKVTDKRSAMGKVTVAHLFMTFPKDTLRTDSIKIKQRIDSVYQKLKAGEKWEDLVKKYSDDKGSAAKGGVLPKFGVNRMVPEFIDAIYKLRKEGDYSEPVKTPYGWHIIKLVERKSPGTFDEEKSDLKQKVNKDSRSQLAKDAVIARLKTEYNLTEFSNARTDFYKAVTDSIFTGKWDVSLAGALTKPLFKTSSSTVMQQEFAQYLSAKQRKKDKEPIRCYVDKMYKDFLEENLSKIENGHLEEKYPEFRNLMNEYRDGILLFDLTDQKVWSKAVKDTTGLKNFHEKNKADYMWDTRLEASIFTMKDPKTAQKVRNFLKSGLADEAVLKEVNSDSVKKVTFESGKYSRKDNKYIDAITWVPGIANDITSDSSTVIIRVKNVLKPEPKSLNESRGLITADYQNYLEKIWIAYLKTKYPVIVNKDVLSQIK
jgi:peptidyl-prolyl cis-trans isomerase SurA